MNSGKHRIAISTTDGLTIHHHFGRTEVFQIVDIEGDTYKFMGRRKVDPSCRACGHNTASFDAVLEMLHDCEAIVVAVIGPGAADYLINRGMRVFNGPGVVEEVLNTIIDKKLLETTASEEPPAEGVIR